MLVRFYLYKYERMQYIAVLCVYVCVYTVRTYYIFTYFIICTYFIFIFLRFVESVAVCECGC